MKTAPVFPPDYLKSLRDAFFPSFGRRHTTLGDQFLFPLGLAAFTGAVTLHLAFYGGKTLLARIRRHVSPPESLPPAEPRQTVSLRGKPTPEDIKDVWDTDPRTLPDRLRIGSRLADLEPTLDSRFVFKKTRNGSRRIVARQPGLKGWMKKHVPAVKYSTAMHYKKLATRLRQLIGLDSRIPLEWLLPDNEEDLSALSPADRQPVAEAKVKLDRLLAENPKVTQLTRTVESKLGIMRMATIRRIQPPKPGRGKRRDTGKNPHNPLISHTSCNGFSVTVNPARQQALWDAVRKILGDPAPDAATRRLQSDIRDWLNAPLQAQRNRWR